MNDKLLSYLQLEQIPISPRDLGSSDQDEQKTSELFMNFLDLGPNVYRPEHSKLYDQPYDLIPKDTDTVADLTAKAQRVVDVIEEGASLALTTRKLLTVNGDRSPEQIACSNMTMNELDFFEAWKGGFLLPSIDFEKSRKPSIGKDVKTRRMRADAMKRMYKHDHLEEEHYLWFAEHYNFLMPLVSAVMKLIKAERNVNQGDVTMSRLDLEECQTINKLVASFTSRQADLAKCKLGFMNRAIHRAVTLATARKAAIHHRCDKGSIQVSGVNRKQRRVDVKQPVKHEYFKRKSRGLPSTTHQ